MSVVGTQVLGRSRADRRWRRLAVALTVVGLALTAPLGAASAAPPPGPTMPVEFDLTRYQPVGGAQFRPVAYSDDGRAFLRIGGWLCQIGPDYRYVGCQGRPATAPRDVRGAAISGDQQGPWRIPDWSNYRFGAPSGFRAPTLPVGKRVTIAGVTCTAPRPATAACRTGSRALIFTPGWHKFFFPSGDTAHSPNPAPRELPPRLQYWNQLPATPAPPR
ncbi:hypothetical protein [Gordonia insulae]|uniref:Uncharacterized protein n=1 Tax=Gordonia insulae TaxID=2420509 RepID=A0A3G8JQB2_9ACTN|nr:hypothetical protein [Gordonia insulae]AZG46689.1 hypothetical protein D7316_03290 [Gordonia insulae]